MLRPSAGDPKPFHIASIVANEALPDGRMAVRLVYYIHEEDNPKDSDPYTVGKPLYSLPLLAVHGSAIQEKLRMIKARRGHGGGYRMQIAATGHAGLGLMMVRQWVKLNSSSLQELGAKREREDPKHEQLAPTDYRHRMEAKRKRQALMWQLL